MPKMSNAKPDTSFAYSEWSVLRHATSFSSSGIFCLAKMNVGRVSGARPLGRDLMHGVRAHGGGGREASQRLRRFEGSRA